jgi:hypothetical protein
MFDEMLKLLQTGHAIATIEQLKKLGMAKWHLSAAGRGGGARRHRFVNAALTDTDRRVGEGKPVAPSFLLACVLWQDVKAGWERRLGQGEPALPALQDAIDQVFERRIGDVSGRGKLAADMREIWVMQPRFEKRAGRVPESMVAQLRFRAGFDFMRLRADIGEVDEALASWWQEYSTADEFRREDLMEQAREEQKSRSRSAPPPARRVPRDATAAAAHSGAPGWRTRWRSGRGGDGGRRHRRAQEAPPPPSQAGWQWGRQRAFRRAARPYAGRGRLTAAPSVWPPREPAPPPPGSAWAPTWVSALARCARPWRPWRPCRARACCASPRCTAARRWTLAAPTTSTPWPRSLRTCRRTTCWPPCKPSSRARAGSAPTATRRARWTWTSCCMATVQEA